MSSATLSRKKDLQLTEFGNSGHSYESIEYLANDIAKYYTSDSDEDSVNMRKIDYEREEFSEPVLDVNWYELRDLSHLNSGSMCSIYICSWKGNSNVVAKLVRTDCADPEVASSDLELELHVLRKVRHPNIVKLVGAGIHPRRGRFLLLERLYGGTLSDRLEHLRKEEEILAPRPKEIRSSKSANPRRASESRKSEYKVEDPVLLSPPSKSRLFEVLQYSLAIANALRYLHSRAIRGYILMHRDLKPDNIAFSLHKDKKGNEVRTIKIIDFGLAKLMRRAPTDEKGRPLARYHMTGETGSPRYMAPECHSNLPYNEKVDVYSFGMCIWEMMELEVPFKDAKSLKTFREDVVVGGSRPALKASHWPVELATLVSSCWHTDIDQRPSFSGIIRELRTRLTEVEQQMGLNRSAASKAKSSIAAAAMRTSWFLRRDSAPSKFESCAVMEKVSAHTPKTAYCSPLSSPLQKDLSADSYTSDNECSCKDDASEDVRGRPKIRSSDMSIRKRQQRRKSSILRLQEALARMGSRFTPPSSPLGGQRNYFATSIADSAVPTDAPTSPMRRIFSNRSPTHKNSGHISPSNLETLKEVGDEAERENIGSSEIRGKPGKFDGFSIFSFDDTVGRSE